MIYFLEDDANIRELVVYTLNRSDLTARGLSLPCELWSALTEQWPDLILLDIMLPEESGLDILRKLRADERTASIPVMMLTANDSEYDKVVGLDLGADDYLTKPFGMMELTARVRALLRRSVPRSQENCLRAGEISLWPDKRLVLSAGEEVTLTRKEFELLWLLMKKKGQVIARDSLIQEVWGYAFQGESRTLDVHIRTLRQKLGQSGEEIETVRGVGYRIRRERDET